MHLADAFVQSDLQCIQAIHLYCQYVCSLGIEPTTFALLTQCSTTEPQEHVVCSVQHTAAELLWQDTALIHNRKSALFAYKPCRLNVSFARWSDVRFFWAHTPEARALKPCQTAPDYWTNLLFKLIRSKHKRFTSRLSWLCLKWK